MVYSRETLIKRFIICTVLGVIAAIALVAVNIAGLFDFGVSDALYYAMILVVAVIVFPLQLVGYTIGGTFKKMIIGYIAPIPIISGLIQNFKAFFYGIKAAIVILKGQDALVIGNSVAENNTANGE